MAKEKDQEFLEYIVKSIVDYPDDVKINRRIDPLGVLLELTINPADMGKIIGKGGQTAKAIRILLRVLGAKLNARLNLKITEPAGSEKSTREKKPVAEDEIPNLEL
jgi:predicted RNA-binding protein YlqC (UPF0109 family)